MRESKGKHASLNLRCWIQKLIGMCVQSICPCSWCAEKLNLCLLLKVFRRGMNSVAVFSPLNSSAPSPWLVVTSPQLFPVPQTNIGDLPDGPAIALELSVLVAQPQASWPLLLKVTISVFYKFISKVK